MTVGGVESFFGRPAEQVAPELLGSVVSCGGVRVRLSEVEAYHGVDDPASHAWRGPTPRNAVMFGPPGRVYVYFIYGMHWAVNLVCGPDGHASAVLLRAGQVVSGSARATARRGDVAPRQLARGPGNLASALGATGTMTGSTVWRGPIRWTPRAAGEPVEVSVGPRVGVTRAADEQLRFWITGDESVSAYRRSRRA